MKEGPSGVVGTAGFVSDEDTGGAGDTGGVGVSPAWAGPRSMRLTEKDPLGPGRLGVYSILGAGAGAVPVPWLPGVAARRITGALVQDVASRYGLALTPDARDALASPFGSTGDRGVVSQAVRFAAGKFLSSRFSPVAFVAPLRGAAFTFAVGHLLARYLETVRAESTVRIELEEARRIRRLVDDALVTTLSFDLASESVPRPTAPEDLRDQTTQVIDSVIIAAASVPDWVLRRLNAAFDRCVKNERR